MRRVSALIAIAIAAIFAMSFSASAEEPTFEAPELELKFNLKVTRIGTCFEPNLIELIRVIFL